MSNLVKWLEKAADGKPIIGVVIGEMGWGDYGKDDVPGYDEQPRGKLLTWDQAKPMLDYEFNSSFGAPGCNAIYAWTDDFVIGISQYDGSTSVFRLPRNPVDCIPDMPGG